LRIHNSIEAFIASRALPDPGLGHVLTIGNFDGCHLGHQALIRSARELAGEGEVCALTFEPRPAVFFRKQKGLPPDEHAPASESLFDARQKAEAMAELGVDHLVFQNFDLPFSQLPAAEFFGAVTAGGCTGIIVGDDFHFGAGRSGDTAFLAAECARAGIAFRRVAGVTVNGVRASSSTIRRELLNAGNVELASSLLGREYALDGEIERGAQNGRRIGIHTANLKALDQIIPRNGVYAGFFLLRGKDRSPSLTERSGEAMPCVINIGHRPTVDSSANPRLSVEAHIIDREFGADEFYGKSARIYFAARLRDEMKFASIDQLKSRIHQDIELARQVTGASRVN
jgi:riboflavin kinase/FMN adenylyltransferase